MSSKRYNIMKRQLLTIILIIVTGTVLGQFPQQNQEPPSANEVKSAANTPELKKVFIGASGGYLFKNKDVANNPMYFLNDGQFGELNLGLRGRVFGWSLTGGYLQINRDQHQFDNIYINSQKLYDGSAVGTDKPANATIPSDQNALFLDKTDHNASEYRDFKGLHFLTGPNFWIGGQKLALNIAAEAGIGLSQFGYYYVSGLSNDPKGTLNIDGRDPSGVMSNYDVGAWGIDYAQYGITQDYFNKINSGSGVSFNEKQKRETHFIGRGTANLEFFVSPSFSLHLGANYWYIKPPKMTGEQSMSIEQVFYVNSATELLEYNPSSSYTTRFKSKEMTFFSGNFGLKFWLGKRKNKREITVVNQPATVAESVASVVKDNKTIIITVVDKQSNTPVSDVEITLTSGDGKTQYKAVTKGNGMAEIPEIARGNYMVTGQIYGIPTSKNLIQQSDFDGYFSSVNTTLEYDDPRFILRGMAININSGFPVKDVKVSLEKGPQKVSEGLTNENGQFNFLLQSNGEYQIQGLKSGLYGNTEFVSTKGLVRSQTLYVTLRMGLEGVEIGKSFVIKNILYNFDDDNINPEAELELDRLVKFMNENPTVRIEISSHTDSRGSDDYNLKLSQRRAQNAMEYLIGRGIAKERLEAKGYGETKLINGCSNGVPCSAQQHQVNRRTEIEIIK